MRPVLPRKTSTMFVRAPSHVMRALPFCLSLLIGCAASSTASAQSCSADDPSTMCMNARLDAEFQTADKKLNIQYQRVMKQLAGPKTDDADYPAVRQSLIDAQRHWLAFRDSDCRGQYTLSEGGSLRGAVFLSCKIERTNVRIKELDDWTQGD